MMIIYNIYKSICILENCHKVFPQTIQTSGFFFEFSCKKKQTWQ